VFAVDVNATTARVLLLLVVPGHLIFMYVIHFIAEQQTPTSILFTVFYLIAALVQVAVLLYFANWLVHFLWKGCNDPDNFAIPYLTALGDLMGTALLGLAFYLMNIMGMKNLR
jgi:solute carrier family 41